MAVICIDENTNENHNFKDEYQMFLDGEIGNYDGGFNAVEQFQAYLVSTSSVHYSDVAMLDLNAPIDLVSTSSMHYSDVALLDLNTVFDCACAINSIYRNPQNYEGSCFRSKSGRKSYIRHQAKAKINRIIECMERMK